MRKIVFNVILALLSLTLIGCNRGFEKTAGVVETNPPENASSNISVAIDIFADKSKTKLRIVFEKPAESGSFGIEYNGRKLTGGGIEDEWFKHSAEFPGYEKTHRFVMTRADGRQSTFEARLEPVDFQVPEPFYFHRLKANELRLSRPFTEDHDLWLAIFDGYLGGFKEIAEFNKTKSAVVVPESTAKRMSVGEAKVRLDNVDFPKMEDDFFKVSMHIDYSSEIKLKVVK